MKLILTFAAVFTGNMALFYVVHTLFPSYRYLLITEGHFVENLTAVIFLGSFLSAVFLLFHSKKRAQVAFPLLVALLGLLGFLDELSFGRQYINLPEPSLYGVGIDAVHDLFKVIYLIVVVWGGPGRVLILAAITAGVVLLYWLWNRHQQTTSLSTLETLLQPRYIFLFLCGLFIFIALVIDLEFNESPSVLLLEELLELNAALALLFCSAALYPKSERRPVPRPI
ncbi:MAG: hypothetical protein M3220_00405 [Chloroflexota bacterium]|nr:hypothetical protein [Chloroflexota bacterium]